MIRREIKEPLYEYGQSRDLIKVWLQKKNKGKKEKVDFTRWRKQGPYKSRQHHRRL